VDGDDRRRGRAERERVLEVRERRPQAAQEPGHRPRHPQLLAPRGQVERLDAVRHELGVAGERDEPEVTGLAPELAEQVRDVRLVARPAPAEDVGVDRDHTSSS
jgi:hypothetical protein